MSLYRPQWRSRLQAQRSLRSNRYDDHNGRRRDRNAIVSNGGQVSDPRLVQEQVGRLWISRRALTEAFAAGGAEASGAFDAMMHNDRVFSRPHQAARRGGAKATRAKA